MKYQRKKKKEWKVFELNKTKSEIFVLTLSMIPTVSNKTKKAVTKKNLIQNLA